MTVVPAASAALTVAGTRVCLERNESPFPPGPAVQAALSQWWSTLHRYPTAGDYDALQQAVARRHQVEAEAVVLGAGSASLLQLISAFLPADSTVVAPWPAWEAHPPLIETHGAHYLAVPLAEDDSIDLDQLAEAITEHTSAVVLTSPHNPTGQPISIHAWNRFLERVPDHVLIVLDEAYYDYITPAHTGLYVEGPQALRDGHDRVIILRSFSKAFGLAGLRAGYALVTPALGRELRARQIPFSVSQLALRAAVAAFDDEAVRMRQIRSLTAERDWLHQQLTVLGLPCRNGHANFLWLPLRDRAAHVVGHLRRHDIDTKFCPGGVRITIGTRVEHEALLAALRDYLR